jgi:endonuclease YncB( thermonuclease family)
MGAAIRRAAFRAQADRPRDTETGHTAPQSAARSHPPHPSRPLIASAVPPAGLEHAERSDDFTFAGQRFLAKVVDVYDGDTIRVVFVWRGEPTQWKVRMVGYDSPELRPPKNAPHREHIAAAGRAAREALRERLSASKMMVNLECGQFDKYGRILATLTLVGAGGGGSVNEWMVSCGHGVPYFGGARGAPPTP